MHNVLRAEFRESETEPDVVAGQEAAARLFYEELLGGREVWPSARRVGGNVLSFLVGDTLVEAGPMHDENGAMLELEVDDPNDVAARCWDAGFTVRLISRRGEAGISVIDPFGRQIALVSAVESDVLEAFPA
jgi:catechol 2,3-dioxygenase-like lactoylglutathione lyase family enzyme